MGLASYFAKRVLQFVPTVFGAVTLVFVLIRLAPGDPLTYILGSMDVSVDAEEIASLRVQYGLDAPVLRQYLEYLWRVLTGDLGTSIHRGVPVVQILLANLGHTVVLAFAGLALAAFFGIPVGVLAAVKRNTRVDYSLMAWAVVGISAPSFWIGLILIYFLGFRLSLFPMYGGGHGSLATVLHALVLPAVAVGLRSAALLARVTRSTVIEVLQLDYIRTARAKGLSGSQVALGHALRNASIPIITVLGVDLAVLLGGTVTIEIVFSRPGLGRLLIDSIFSRDYPVIQGVIIVFAVFVIIVNLIVDLLYAAVDPRVTYE